MVVEQNKEHPEKEFVYVPVPQIDQEDEIDLLELWNVIWRGKWFIMGCSLLCTLIAVYVTLYKLPVTYKSNIVLQPMQSDNSTMSKLSGLIGNLPLPINLNSGGDKSANIVAFLKSRNLKARLIKKYNLLPRFYKDIWDTEKQQWVVDDPEAEPTVVKALQQNIMNSIFQVNQDMKTSLITISWIDTEPEFTATMLNNVVKELLYYLDNEYETDAKREREFIDKQLKQSNKELEYWENQVPSQKLTLAKIQRERLVAQTIYAELRKQLELAKISEARELVSFKILDNSFIPEKKYKPKRSMICLLTLIIAGMSSIFIIFFIRFISNIKKEKKALSK